MPNQPDLFAEDNVTIPPLASTRRELALDLGAKGPRLSPAQQRFNRLLARIDKLKQQAEQCKPWPMRTARCITAPWSRCEPITRSRCGKWRYGWMNGCSARV